MRSFVVVLALLLAPVASAGGGLVDVAVHGGTVWTVGDFGVRAFGVADGSTVYAPQPTAARYDLGVAIAGDAAFVASIANGYTDGEVTRIDLRAHTTRIVWRRPNASAQYVVAGASGVYVLVGAKAGNSVLRFSTTGRATGHWSIADAGRIAADASGCWVATTHGLLQIRPDGRVVEALRSVGLDDVATGGGDAWLISTGKLIRVDERTGVGRRLHAPGLRPIGVNHELAVGDGFLWTVDGTGLQRRSLRTGALERTAVLGREVDAVAVAGGAVWVASGDELYRVDPVTLSVTLRVSLL